MCGNGRFWIKARRGDEFMNAQGDEGIARGRNLRINELDEKFITTWYKDICGEKNFKQNYLKFMGADATDDDPRPGSNRRILAAFFNNDKDHERMNAVYLLGVYHHTACGDRADSENWYWSLAFLVGLVGLAIVLLVEFLIRVHAERWDSLSWLILVLSCMYVVAGVVFYNWRNKIIGFLRSLRNDDGR